MRMNRRVSIWKHVRLANGKWRYSCASFSAGSEWSRQRSGSGPRYANSETAFRRKAGTSGGSFSVATRLT